MPEPDFPAEGTALVLGGSGGVGRAICEGLAAAGARVALTYRSNVEGAKEAAAAVERHGAPATIHPLDLATGDGDPAGLVEDLVQATGGLHTLVLAAGSRIDQPRIADLDEAELARVLDADVTGFFRVLKAALPSLRERAGSIVAVSSSGLTRFPPGDILSVAPKASIEALVRGVAREEGKHGVRANIVRLGVVEAGMFPRLVERGELDARWIEAAKRNTPLRRFAAASEVADAVVYLASRRASYLTGQVLGLDGGYGL